MPLIQIGEIVDCLNTQPVIFIPPTIGDSYDERGKRVEGTPSVPVEREWDIQPASGRMLQMVPEGERTIEHVTAFLTGPFIDTTNEVVNQRAHRLVYRGLVWKCVGVPEDWRENGYQKALFQNTKQVYTP